MGTPHGGSPIKTSLLLLARFAPGCSVVTWLVLINTSHTRTLLFLYGKWGPLGSEKLFLARPLGAHIVLHVLEQRSAGPPGQSTFLLVESASVKSFAIVVSAAVDNWMAAAQTCLDLLRKAHPSLITSGVTFERCSVSLKPFV